MRDLEEVIEMAEKAGIGRKKSTYGASNFDLQKFARLIAENEREACAKVCDEALFQLNETANQLEDSEYMEQCAIQGAMTQSVKLAKAIRARG